MENRELKQRTNTLGQKNACSGPGVTSTPESPALPALYLVSGTETKRGGEGRKSWEQPFLLCGPMGRACGSAGFGEGGVRTGVEERGVRTWPTASFPSLSSGHGRTGSRVPALREVSSISPVCQRRSLIQSCVCLLTPLPPPPRRPSQTHSSLCAAPPPSQPHCSLCAAPPPLSPVPASLLARVLVFSMCAGALGSL